MENRIKKCRKAMGLTQEDLCNILGWKIRRLQSYERGVRMPSVYDAIAIADALGVYVEYLFGRE